MHNFYGLYKPILFSDLLPKWIDFLFSCSTLRSPWRLSEVQGQRSVSRKQQGSNPGMHQMYADQFSCDQGTNQYVTVYFMLQIYTPGKLSGKKETYFCIFTHFLIRQMDGSCFEVRNIDGNLCHICLFQIPTDCLYFL